MLEKIGLPAKPSQRGNTWVVDASHCQGCSSQFTFINRKHHCRRCGGIFCNSCTQQRMVLRGQGDSPVRICEPCKKLEEAARFEMRYGSRSRVVKGSSKSIAKTENEILNEILGNERKVASESGVGSSSKAVTSIDRTSSLNAQEVVRMDGGEKVHRINSLGEFNNLTSERESSSPEDLRQKAVEEKKKYKVLKAEGKSDEALRAFKRGKELERQADALEISLRKSRRKALHSQNVEENQIKDEPGESRRGNKAARTGKEKDDLAAELKELGWSDMDLHNEDNKKGKTVTLEGEFSSLLGEISEKTTKDKGINAFDKSQVLAHKKKALALKREGNLEEAKEELKKAKVLERQLEEQELLAAAEDSDDELSALIRSMDSDKQELSSNLYEQDHDFDLGSLVGAAEQVVDGNFDVTDEDMEDPEIVAALKSLGWVEDSDSCESIVPQIGSVDKEALSNEILSLKREALSQKRAGNVPEAMVLLKKAKLLERDLESFESQEGKFAKEPTRIQKDLTRQANSQSSPPKKVSDENNATKIVDLKLAPKKTKLMIQKELLALKKKALALRREGRLDEAEELLKEGKILELQLEEMEKAPSNTKAMSVASQSKVSNSAYDNLPIGDEEREGVTDQDMSDPTYLSLLQNLGWKDEHNDLPSSASRSHDRNDSHPMQITESSVSQAAPVVPVKGPRRSKAEIQRELLGLKRKALALRRQGESEEAEEVLRKAKDLEAQIADMEQSAKEVQVDISTHSENISKFPLKSSNEEVDAVVVSEKDMRDPAMLSMLKNLGWADEEQENVTMHDKHNEKPATSVHSNDTSVAQSSPPVSVVEKRSKGEIQRELLTLKRKALALRRKGETEEAEEVLNKAKALEAQIEELEAPKQVQLQEALKDEKPNNPAPGEEEEHGNAMSNSETSRGSSQATAGPHSKFIEVPFDAEIMGSDTANHGFNNSSLAFPLNSPLVEGTSIPQHGDSNLIDLLTGDEWGGSQRSSEKHEDSVLCDEKPDIYESNPVVMHTSVPRNDGFGAKKQENIVRKDEKPHVPEANSTEENASVNDESALKQDILARKRKAVALKREGKLAEAREELRQAKLMEKRLSEDDAKSKTSPAHVSVSTPNASSASQKERGSPSTVTPKPMSSRDRFKLQQESLAHKRQALKLRREGRTEEAEAEFELAKALETQLEELSAHDPNNSVAEGADLEGDVGVEDFLDPQLLSALKAIGIDDANVTLRAPDRPQPSKPNVAKSESPNRERIQLEEQIKAEKVKAVTLKRSGKQAEALDALRKAKLLEKKLNSLS